MAWTYIHNVGDYAKNETCVMGAAVAKWRASRGEPIGTATDHLECACPVIRQLAIRRNDATPLVDLSAWAEPMVDRIIGSRNDALTVKRAEAVARYAVTVIAPEALRAAGRDEDADRLAAMSTTATMAELRDAARSATAYAAAAYAAAAYAAAARAAARAAAWAAAYAAAAAAGRIRHLDAMIELAFAVTA